MTNRNSLVNKVLFDKDNKTVSSVDQEKMEESVQSETSEDRTAREADTNKSSGNKNSYANIGYEPSYQEFVDLVDNGYYVTTQTALRILKDQKLSEQQTARIKKYMNDVSSILAHDLVPMAKEYSTLESFIGAVESLYKQNDELGVITSINLGSIVAGAVDNSIYRAVDEKVERSKAAKFVCHNSMSNLINTTGYIHYSIRSSNKNFENELIAEIQNIINKFNEKSNQFY